MYTARSQATGFKFSEKQKMRQYSQIAEKTLFCRKSAQGGVDQNLLGQPYSVNCIAYMSSIGHVTKYPEFTTSNSASLTFFNTYAQLQKHPFNRCYVNVR